MAELSAVARAMDSSGGSPLIPAGIFTVIWRLFTDHWQLQAYMLLDGNGAPATFVPIKIA